MYVSHHQHAQECLVHVYSTSLFWIPKFSWDVELPQNYQHPTKILESRTSSLRGVYQTLLCVLVIRDYNKGATRSLRVSTDGSSRWLRCLTHLEHMATNLDNHNKQLIARSNSQLAELEVTTCRLK